MPEKKNSKLPLLIVGILVTVLLIGLVIFFSIKLDDLVLVFLSEVDATICDEDKNTLGQYTVQGLFDMPNKDEEDTTQSEKMLIELFNKYYNCKAGN